MAQTSPASGKEMFVAYCAACHGRTGVGDGPVAAALKTPPSDLTILAKKNGGKFPADHVMQLLRTGPADTKAHGSAEMPVWGPLFSATLDSSTSTSTQRIYNLSKHLESIQVK